MKRREISAAFLAGAGVALGTRRAEAGTCAAPCYPQTAAELTAGVMPTNTAYAPGNVLRYGANSSGVSNSTAAFQKALDCNGTVYVPNGFYKIRRVSLGAAGRTIRGESRYETVLEPWDDPQAPGAPMFHFALSATHTSYGHLFENLAFHFYDMVGHPSPRAGTEVVAVGAVGIDLGSINNSIIRGCRFKGRHDSGTNGVGVIFASPVSGGAYSNAIIGCDFSCCETGVRFSSGANHNLIVGGEFVQCATGVDAAPPSNGELLDTPRIYGSRIEHCNVGLKEGAQQGMYFGVRFEENSYADVWFQPGSTQAHFIGGSTATSTTPFRDLQYAEGLVCLAPDLFHNVVTGISVLGPAPASADLIPAEIGGTATYVRGGRLVLDTAQWITARTPDKQGIMYLIMGSAAGVVEVGASGRVDVGNTAAPDRTRVFKPCFQTSGGSVTGSIVDKFPVYDANGSLVGYVPIYNS